MKRYQLQTSLLGTLLLISSFNITAQSKSQLYLFGVNMGVNYINPGAPNRRPSNDYFIVGMLKNAAGATVYLREVQIFKEDNTIDSTMADSYGNFSFKGHVEEPTLYIVHVRNKRGAAAFILENSLIKIVGNADSVASLAITGSKENDIFTKAKELSEIKRVEEIYGQNFNAFVENDTNALNNVHKQLQQTLPKLTSAIKTFVSSYPTAYASVMLLTYFPSIDTYFPDLHAIDSAVSVLNLFSETSVTNHTQFAFVKDQIKSCIATSIGKPAPEILQPDTAGQTISLSGLKGKYVFLDFWASWCLPCRKANSYLATAYKKYSSKNFTILSISLDENRSDWIKAIHKDGMTWINTSELKANNNTAQLSYGVKALPANFLIDPTGKIVAKGLKAEQLEKQLAVFLK